MTPTLPDRTSRPKRVHPAFIVLAFFLGGLAIAATIDLLARWWIR